MGAVYEVRHTTLDRRAALKVIHTDGIADPEAAKRFLQEAKATSLIQHPGIVDIYDYGQSEDILYIVMEYLDGESLSARLRRLAKTPAGRYGLAGTLLLQQVARALAAVHKEGFIHRDLKPGNIVVVADGDVPGGERAKVLDFGIAKAMTQAGSAAAGAEIKTRTGLLMGTPDYMAPEQWRSQKLDGRVDVYALGCILFETLIGRVPFSAPEMPALAFLHCFEPPPSLFELDPQLPPELCALCKRMLEKDPARRPIMSEAADALGRILGQPLGTGSHAAIGPAAPLSPQAKAALDTEPRTLSGRVFDKNLDDAIAQPVPPAATPVAPAEVVPVEVAAVETAPMKTTPAAPKKTVSFTAPTLTPAERPMRWLPLVVLICIASATGTWALLHDGNKKAVPVHLDLGLPATVPAPPPPDLAAPPDLSQMPDLVAEPPRPRSHCVARQADAFCILTPMSPRQREKIDSALKEDVGVRLCPGERLVITGLLSHLDVQAPSSVLKRQSLNMFRYALKGLPMDIGAFPAKVEIQCAR